MRIIYTRPKLYKKQEAAIFTSSRYTFVEASTKAGKTHGAIARIVEEALDGRVGFNYWWVAPSYGQARIAFTRLKRAARILIKNINESLMRVELRNGTFIWFKSGEIPDNLYGEDVYYVVLDEASRSRSEVFHAIVSVLTATGGGFLGIGNVQGKKNWFYIMARRAEAGEPNMSYSKLTALDAVAAGVISQDVLDDAKRNLPAHVFHELYMAEAADDGSNPFSQKAIEACAVASPSGGTPAVWGWDLAKSHDWTVGIALDADGRMTHFERWQDSWNNTIARILRLTNNTPALVDSTGVGDPVLEQLQVEHNNFEGYRFSSESKQKLMEGLAINLQRGDIKIYGDVLSLELNAFEYSVRAGGRVAYSAPQGMHDDCVCALALATNLYGQKVRGDMSNKKMVEIWSKAYE